MDDAIQLTPAEESLAALLVDLAFSSVLGVDVRADDGVEVPVEP